MSDSWNTADLTHGDASAVAARLNTAATVTLECAVSALINALNRISALESRLAEMERRTVRAANTASCLANGIQPD